MTRCLVKHRYMQPMFCSAAFAESTPLCSGIFIFLRAFQALSNRYKKVTEGFSSTLPAHLLNLIIGRFQPPQY
jgi:hypothetical protein